MVAESTEGPVLIMGAGLVGLTFAQALKKENVPFLIFEKDAGPESRGHRGWAITIHWALETLERCLPEAVFQHLGEAQVDPAVARDTTSRFMFLDLSNAVPKHTIPSSRGRLRLHRKKFRDILLEGIDVQWGKAIDSFIETERGIEVTFRDGSKAHGRLLVGADGANSRTRQLLSPEAGNCHQLPVRFVGATVKFTAEEAEPLRAIDPLLFFGSHPETGTFMWFSILTTPEGKNDGSGGYEAQVWLSWIVKRAEDEVPVSDAERLAKMKAMATPFEERLRTAIQSIPEATEITEIKVQDWPAGEWDNRNGKVTLIGDSAHAMTMYRGEGVNYGITDAKQLLEALISIPISESKDHTAQRRAISHYESQMRAKAHDAVLLSRQACLEAHDLKALTDESAVVSRRAILTNKAVSSAA